MSKEKVDIEKKYQFNSKYLRIETSDREGLRQIGSKVQNGEAKWAYYGIDNDKGYHYFLLAN